MPRLLIARFERRCLETRITALVTVASESQSERF